MSLNPVGQDGDIIAIEGIPPWETPALPDHEEDNFDLYLVTYMSQGLRVKGYLVLPKDEQQRQFPGLVYCRGGIRRVGMVRLSRMIQLAKKGYAVFAPVYRGNLGGEGREDFGGEDRHDLIHAVKALLSHPRVMAKPVPLIGFSRGALMALLAAGDCSEVGPVVVWGGVSDLFYTYEERVDLRRMLRRVVGHPKKQSEAYHNRSPRYWVEHVHNPILIIHGSQDQQVHVRHAHQLASALEQYGKTYAMRLYDGLGHVFPEDSDKDALEAIFDWLEKYAGGEVSDDRPRRV
jgi:dipeptidyl aminopeptidase/acylaminoacyl peptidase